MKSMLPQRSAVATLGYSSGKTTTVSYYWLLQLPYSEATLTGNDIIQLHLIFITCHLNGICFHLYGENRVGWITIKWTVSIWLAFLEQLRVFPVHPQSFWVYWVHLKWYLSKCALWSRRLDYNLDTDLLEKMLRILFESKDRSYSCRESSHEKQCASLFISFCRSCEHSFISNKLPNILHIQRPVTHDSRTTPLAQIFWVSSCCRDYDVFWLVLVHQHSSIFRRNLTTDWASVCIGLRTVWEYILCWFLYPPLTQHICNSPSFKLSCCLLYWST